MTKLNRVVIEAGSKKAFASALDWPGWSRSGKGEEDAIKVLLAYTDRYRKVTDLAGVKGLVTAARDLDVVDRIPGTGATDFGVPDIPSVVEEEQMPEAECERQVSILRACWAYFDDVTTRVSEELQKGPRGGGRNRTQIIEHTIGADRGYARNLGLLTPASALVSDDGIREHREAVYEAVRDLNRRGESARKWPVRYFLRRAAWHVLDHAWEMEDKDLTGKV